MPCTSRLLCRDLQIDVVNFPASVHSGGEMIAAPILANDCCLKYNHVLEVRLIVIDARN